MATNQKPKAASKITRNPDRRNGKAYAKHSGPTTTAPGTEPKSAKGGRCGYSRKRIEQIAKDKGIPVFMVYEQLEEKMADRKARKRGRTYSHAFRSGALRPGIGEVNYKMAGVDRRSFKQQPYPIVPKGSAHAGKADSKTDTTEAKQKREARRNGGKAERPQVKIMEVQAALRKLTGTAA